MPMNLPLLAERHELFIILSIGEVVAAGLALPEESDGSAATAGGGGHEAGGGGHEAGGGGHDLVRRTTDFAAEVLLGSGDSFDNGDGSGSSGSHGGGGGGSANGHGESHEVYNEYAVVGLVVVMAGLLKILLFDLEDHPVASGAEECGSKRQHALARNRYTGVMWYLMHLPLNMSLVLLGSVIEPLRVENHMSEFSHIVAAECVMCILLIKASFEVMHTGGGGRTQRRITKQWRVVARSFFAIVIGLLPAMRSFAEAPLMFLGLVDALLASAAFFTLYARLPVRAIHG